MRVARWNRLYALGVGLLALGCGGSGTAPPGPPMDLVKSGGDGQSWYFNNPLPTSLSVTAQDVDGRAVPGVVVTWTVASGGGGVSPAQSTTNASGIATTTDSIGFSTLQRVSATFTGLAGPATFTETATTPPTSAGVTVGNNFFAPKDTVVQTGRTVTWTWSPGGTTHSVTFDNGPAPLPAETVQSAGTKDITFAAVGTYSYHCKFHAGMSGTVTVVH